MGKVTERHAAPISTLEARRPFLVQRCFGPLSHPPQEGGTPLRRPRRLAPDPFRSDPAEKLTLIAEFLEINYIPSHDVRTWSVENDPRALALPPLGPTPRQRSPCSPWRGRSHRR